MSSKRLTQEYKNRKIELIRRIELCKESKEKIISTLKKLNDNYDHGILSYEQYNKKLDTFLGNRTIEEWIKYYDDSIDYSEKELENCDTEIGFNNIISYRYVFVLGLILLIIATMFLRPSITGYFTASEPTETFTDGYSIENNQDKWADINGEMMYARCLKVKSEINFSEIKIDAKITSTGDSKDLIFGLYNNNNETDEPLEKLGECSVNDYSTIWKSCNIRLENQQMNDYWICTYVQSGNNKNAYFTIAYANGDNKKTALWTGSYWQKLEGSSYIIKGEFMRW